GTIVPSLPGPSRGASDLPRQYPSSVPHTSAKADTFTESVIREMTRLAVAHGAVNLAQGFPDFPAPAEIKEAAVAAIRSDVNQYEPDWSFDPDELRAAFGPKTRGLVLNSPHNPTGKVFTREELAQIAELCIEHDVVVFTDEIYEHILYSGTHIPMATLPGMAERTVAVNAMSKTYSVTGWRVGWVIASPELSASIRKVHDFLTVGAAAPLQEAGTVALSMPDDYYAHLGTAYRD